MTPPPPTNDRHAALGTPKRGAPPRHWQLNWRVLIGTAAAIGVLAVLAMLWHGHAARRNGTAFLSRADALAEEGKWDEAAKYLHQYLEMFPDDDDVRIRLALTFDHVVDLFPEKTPSAERLYAVAVGAAPDRPDLRRGHALRLLQLGRHSAARLEAEKLLELVPSDPRGLYIRAMAVGGEARARGDQPSLQKLALALGEAIDQLQGTAEHVKLTEQLADLYRSDLTDPPAQQRKALADSVMDEMVEANQDRPDAWAARFFYRHRFDGAGANEDLDRALQSDPETKNVEVQLAAAARAADRQELQAARGFYEQATKASPGDPRGYIGLSRCYLADENVEQALATLQAGLTVVSPIRAAELDVVLIDVLIKDGTVARMDEAQKHLEAAARRLDALAGRIAQRTIVNTRGQLDALRARWHMARQEFGAAAELLKRGLLAQENDLTRADEVAARANLYMQLGQSYLALRRFDQAATAFKDAAVLHPQSVQPRLAAARAWQSAGRLDEAVRECRQATLLAGDHVPAWVMLIESQAQQQLMLSAAHRDWTAVETTVEMAQKACPDAEPLRTVATQLANLQAGGGKTVTLLEQSLAANPTSLVVAERLVAAYASAGRSDAAEQTVSQFEKSGATFADVVTLRAALLMQRDEVEGAEKLLRETAGRLPPEDGREVQRRLAGLYLRTEKLEQAREILVELAKANETDEMLLGLLADLAMQARNVDELLRWETELQKREGPDGTNWRFYRAERLLIDAAADDRLEAVSQLAQEIQRLRPLWSAGFVLRGQIAQRLGKTDEAIDALQKSIALGERRPATLERLAALQFAANRVDDANQTLAKVSKPLTSSPHLANLAISIRLRKGDTAAAIEIARQLVAEQPQDPGDRVMLAQTLLAAGKHEEAEAAFRQAVEIDPENPASWQALFGHQTALRQVEAARQTLQRMASSVKLPDAELQLLLGQDLSLLGDREGATACYRTALKSAPQNVTALRRLAGVLATSRPDEAERYLREARRWQPSSAAVRNELVSLLIARGGDDRLAEAWALLDEPLSEGDDASEAQGLKARILARRGRNGDRDRAKQLLTDLVARGRAKDGDRLMLVGMHQADGNSREALLQASALANREKPVPEQLAAYIDLLLVYNRTKEAKTLLARLAELDPKGFGTLSLKARVLAAEDQAGAVEPLVEQYLHAQAKTTASDEAKAALLLKVANLYAQIPLDAAAERTLRSLNALKGGDSTPLALWLARHQRTPEAIDLCLRAAAADATPRSVVTLLQALVVGHADVQQGARAEPVIIAGLKRHADNVELLFAAGTWRLVQERDDEAAPLLRKVLAIQPTNVMAMNNLVNLLAERPATRSEALHLIDEALARVGRIPELLDTKGMILIFSEDFSAAVPLFEEAVSRPRADPLHKLHMALAYHRVGRPDDARRWLAEARDGLPQAMGVRARDLTTLKELERDL